MKDENVSSKLRGNKQDNKWEEKMLKTAQIIGIATDLEYFVGTATFSLDQIIKHGTPSIQYYLPYWGLAFGVLNMVSSVCRFRQIYVAGEEEQASLDPNVKDQYRKRWNSDNKNTLDVVHESYDASQILNLLAGGYLTVESLRVHATGAGGLFSGLAICSAANLLSNIYNLLKLAAQETKNSKIEQRQTQLIIDVVKDILELVGWTLLTLGNPIGWYVVAAATAFTLIHGLMDISIFKTKIDHVETLDNREVPQQRAQFQ